VYEYSARLLHVVDGDTVDLDVDLGMHIHTKQRVRLLGINCPEHGTIAGNDATAFTKAWIDEHGPDLVLRTVLDRAEKYGRILGQVVAGGRMLNNDLVTAGLAVDYDGGRRTLTAQPGEPDPTTPVP
jgi:endonuclease YncB( thermonuclease family)